MTDFGQTPIDPNEMHELIPGHIQLLSELNQFESENILQAQKKYFRGTFRHELADFKTLQGIHHKMFCHTWKWAGKFRKSDKNIGVDWRNISEELKKLCDDVKFWKLNNTYSNLEIAVRFHHRLVWIHCFPNGNGRHARLVADLFMKSTSGEILPWSYQKITSHQEYRKSYISALRNADLGNYTDLIKFASS